MGTAGARGSTGWDGGDLGVMLTSGCSCPSSRGVPWFLAVPVMQFCPSLSRPGVSGCTVGRRRAVALLVSAGDGAGRAQGTRGSAGCGVGARRAGLTLPTCPHPFMAPLISACSAPCCGVLVGRGAAGWLVSVVAVVVVAAPVWVHGCLWWPSLVAAAVFMVVGSSAGSGRRRRPLLLLSAADVVAVVVGERWVASERGAGQRMWLLKERRTRQIQQHVSAVT